jgi:oligopeptide/dipeptide ABC transporter ATP-binding protein
MTVGTAGGAAANGRLLEVQDLRVEFPIYGGLLRRKVGAVRAVDRVSFELRAGETLGLVGESGCGKTTVARAVVNLLRSTAPGVAVGGSIHFHSSRGPVDLVSLGRKAMRPYRAEVNMIFQDPYSSLNPRMTIQQIVEAPLRIHTRMTRAEREERVRWLLDRAGLQAEHAGRYPHEFSGGQRQRIGIARALATSPRLIAADEPVSALDVSIQAQVVNLLEELQDELGLTYLFVAHDLNVVHHIADRIAVMYLGNLIEVGEADEVIRRPLHPYTAALLSAVPRPAPRGRDRSRRIRLTGEVPNPLQKPPGCPFHPRCPIARPSCARETPALADRGGGHQAACPYV